MRKIKLNVGECYSILGREGKKSFIDFADYLGQIDGAAYFQLKGDEIKYAIASPADHLVEREDDVIKLDTSFPGALEVIAERDLEESLLASLSEVTQNV